MRTAFITSSSRAVRRAASGEARGTLGGQEPYTAKGGRQ
jgi:hypothetical protein